MREFGEWFATGGAVQKPAPKPASEQYPIDTENGLQVRYFACCRSCEKEYEWPGEPEQFSQAYNFCGGSDKCMP